MPEFRPVPWLRLDEKLIALLLKKQGLQKVASETGPAKMLHRKDFCIPCQGDFKGIIAGYPKGGLLLPECRPRQRRMGGRAFYGERQQLRLQIYQLFRTHGAPPS